MAVMWRVRLLGGLEAESDDKTIARFRTQRVALLLAYLTYYNHRTHSREELAEMLWPDLDPDHARRNLRQALSSLRHHLEPPGTPAGAVVEAQKTWIRLNPNWVTSDVAELHAAIKAGARSPEHAASIVQLYRGSLLPGFYEDWVQQERLLLEDEYVGALQTCLRAAEREGRLDDGIRYARLGLAQDGFRSDLHESLIRLYLATDRTSSALAHFDEWRSLAESQLGFSPNPELRSIIESIRGSQGNPSSEDTEPIQVAPQQELEQRDKSSSQVVRLPIHLSRYFGRHVEQARALETLSAGETRLMTFTGPAGTGKTRMSVETGRALAEQHGWNVWFVPLADASDADGIVDSILTTVRIKAERSAPIDALSDRFSDPQNLLILDNLEHIIEPVCPVISAILEASRNVAILTTSRQALKLEGEQEFHLGTLPVPFREDEAPTLADLMAVPSVSLFIDRARSVLPDFTLTARNAAAVGELCRKLDGLPLALEIAAGLAGAVSPGQLLQNLDGRLELLKSRRRDLNSRHRSLRAAIDYSYNLLDSPLQRFFVSLSVFRGGFTVEAACVVGMPETPGSEKQRHGATLRRILDLLERSLLYAEETKPGSSARFRLLESYREYGAELLEPAQEMELRQRHAEYFLDESTRGATGGDDRENRMAAVHFYLGQRQVGECVSLLRSFGRFALAAQDVVATLAGDKQFESFEPVDRVRILWLRMDAAIHRSEFQEALRICEMAGAIAAEHALKEEKSFARRKFAEVLSYLGREQEAIDVSEETLAECLAADDLEGAEIAYTNIGSNRWSLGDMEGARAALTGAYSISLKLRKGRGYWPVLYNLANVNYDLGLLDDGLITAREGLRLAQEDEDEFGISMLLALVCRYHLLKGSLAAALSTSYESLVHRRRGGSRLWTLQSFFVHALILSEMGFAREAATLLGSSMLNGKADYKDSEKVRNRVRTALSESEFERAWAEGLSMTIDQAFRFASNFR